MSTAEKNVFLLPGQGSPYQELGRQLTEKGFSDKQTIDIANKTFDEVEEGSGLDVHWLISQESEEILRHPMNAHIGLLATGVSKARALMAKGRQPSYVKGHSVGEWGAAHISGALSLKDAAIAAKERGRLMYEAAKENPGGMMIVRHIEDGVLEEICKKTGVFLSHYNSTIQSGVVGKVELLEEAKRLIQEAGGRAKNFPRLNFAPHSPHMSSAESQFIPFFSKIEVKDAVIPFIADRTGLLTTKATEIRENLAGQLTRPVHFKQGIALILQSSGVKRFIEMAPAGGKVLTGLVKDEVPVERSDVIIEF